MFRPILPVAIAALSLAPLSIVHAQDLSAAYLELVRSSDEAGLKTFWDANPTFTTPEKLGEALREAITARDETLAKAIVERGGTPEVSTKIVNALDAQGRNSLFYAVEANSPSLITYLLSKGGDANVVAVTGRNGSRGAQQSPIDRAYVLDNPAILAQLLTAFPPKPTPNSTYYSNSNNTKFTLQNGLALALASGNKELVAALLALKPKLDDGRQMSQIWMGAALGGNLDNIKALIAAGAPLEGKNENDSPMFVTALVAAILAEKPELVTYFLENGADINRQSMEGSYGNYITPLIAAMRVGNSSLVDQLLEKGVQVNPRYGSQSPLRRAIQTADYVTATKLLAKGANMDGSIATARDAALRNDTTALEKYKAEVNTENEYGETPLHYAAIFGTPQTLDWFKAAGAKSIPDKTGQSPIFWAVRAGNQPALEWFLANGAKPTATDGIGQNLLHVAAPQGSEAMIKSLLAAGVDPDGIVFSGGYETSASQRGVTPLHRAALAGNLPAMRVLLAGRASSNALTNGKLTPLHFAAQNGQNEAVQLLLQSGADPKIGQPILISAVTEPAVTTSSSDTSRAQIRPALPVDRAATVTTLLAAGADPKANQTYGGSVLQAAVQMSARRSDYDDSYSSSSDPLTAIRRYWLTQKSGPERAKVVAALIKAGADANGRIGNSNDYSSYRLSSSSLPGNSLLQIAIENQDMAVVETLLAGGADVNLENSAGRTALDIALRRGEVSAQFLDVPFANMTTDSYNRSGQKPPMFLPDTARQALLDTLTKRKARMGRGPFLRAISWGAAKWVKNTLAETPDLLKVTAYYEGPPSNSILMPIDATKFNADVVSIAMDAKHSSLVRFLIEKGAGATTSGPMKRSLLFNAAVAGDWELVDVLLKRGMKWEADANGQNPLHVAVQKKDANAVKELLKRGVPVDQQDQGGWTPLSLAREKDALEIVNLLQAAMPAAPAGPAQPAE